MSARESTSAYSVHPNRAKMNQEIDAYQVMHQDLVSNHLGEYVAIFQGKLVDHDVDPVALHRRVKTRFPNEIVLSRKITTSPERVIQVRSPRLERVS